MTVNYDDPASVLAVLRPALLALLAGQQAQTVRIPTGNGGYREVIYHNANITALQAEVARWESKLPKTGRRPRRFCIRAG